MKAYELPNSQIVEVYTLKELAAEIKEHKNALQCGFADVNDEEFGLDVVYKNGLFYADNEIIRTSELKATGISSAEIRNPMTFAVYGNFKLCDVNTGVEYTIEEAMKREDVNVCYNVNLY